MSFRSRGNRDKERGNRDKERGNRDKERGNRDKERQNRDKERQIRDKERENRYRESRGNREDRYRANRGDRSYHADRHYFRDHAHAVNREVRYRESRGYYAAPHDHDVPDEDAKTKFCDYAYDSDGGLKTAPTQQGNTCYAHAFTAQAHAIHEKRGGKKSYDEMYNDGNWRSNDNFDFDMQELLQEQCMKNNYVAKPHTNIQGVQNEIDNNRPVTMGIKFGKKQWNDAAQYLQDEPKAVITKAFMDRHRHSVDEEKAHAMNVMGVYDGKKGQYLNIRNQSGTDFADNGYLRMTPNALPTAFVNLAGKEDNASQDWNYDSADLGMFILEQGNNVDNQDNEDDEGGLFDGLEFYE